MLPRAARSTGTRLRPTLRLWGDAGHIFPVLPRSIASAQSMLPATLCPPHLSCRYGSSRAKNNVTHKVEGKDGVKNERTRPYESYNNVPKRPSSANEIGRLVSADVQLATRSKGITLKFEKLGEPVSMSMLWLRDACQCHLCVSESSGQKRFATCDIPSDLEVDSLKVLEDGSLEVSWANDMALGSAGHVSTYPLALLHEVVMARNPYKRHIPAREIWDSQSFEKDSQSREISYVHWMEDSLRFAEAFRNLYLWGIVVIKGVPQTEAAVEQVASRLGHLQATLYGPTWDVVSKPQAENVAYTNEFLCLHQDLMYLNEPPRIQVLHCLENGCEGGDSLFSDGLRAAHELRLKDIPAYQTLTATGVDFHYAKGGHYWHNSHVTIVKSGPGATATPLSVRWSPPFQAPFWSANQQGNTKSSFVTRAGSLVEKWQEAAKAFRDTLEVPAHMVQFRMQPGDCVVFDNWRVLHGRRAFDTASGSRHLRGTYVEDQALTSTWLRLQREGLIFTEEQGWPGPKEIEIGKANRIMGIKHDAIAVGQDDGEVKA